MSRITYWLCNASGYFYATQPDNCIDQNRVDYFIKQITSGERPFAIIMQASCSDLDLVSSYFIIDGHHKFLAYKKLVIEKISTLLFPFQTQDILEQWEEIDAYKREKLKNPDSPLHRFFEGGLLKS